MSHPLFRSSLVLASLLTLLPGQAPLFPNPLLRLTGLLPGGTLAGIGRGLLVDVDGDGDDDCVALAQDAIVVCVAANGSFSNPGIAFPSGGHPVDLAPADVDGDGDQDIVVLCWGNNAATAPELRVHLNDGSGSLGTAVTSPLNTSYSRIQAGRMNSDAVADLVLLDGSPLTSVTLLGQGGGLFGTPLPGPQAGNFGAYHDGDQDGDDDFYTVSGGALLVRINDGAAGFAPAITAATGISPSGFFVAFGDVDADGDGDAVIFGNNGFVDSVVQVARRDAPGVFTTRPAQVLTPRPLTFGPLLSDIDGDAAVDLVAYDGNNGFPGSSLLHALNDGTGTFSATAIFEYPPNLSWSSVATGDATGDGLGDVVIFTQGFTIPHPSLGASGLQGAPQIPIPGVTADSVFCLGDLDRDGLLDAVATHAGGSPDAYAIVRSLATAPVISTLPTVVSVNDIDLGDFNCDGILDLLAAVSGPVEGVSLRIGDGSGGFLAPTFAPTTGTPTQVIAADVDGDSHTDAVVRGTGLDVLLGDGAGGFTQTVSTVVCAPPCPPGTPGRVALADMDRDGVLDVVASQGPALFSPAMVRLFLGAGDGSFNHLASQSTPSFVQTPAIADVDGDGILDVVGGGGSLHVVLGSPSGGLSAPAQYPIPGPFTGGVFGGSVAAGDVDGDGDVDILFPGGALFTNGGNGTFDIERIYLSAGGQRIALADVDADLQVDAVILDAIASALMILGNQTTCTGRAIDYGLGCPGSGGFIPRLSARGCAQPAGTITLAIEGALGGTPAWLLMGPTPVIAPLGLGCSLFVDPSEASLVPLPLTGPVVPGAGSWSLSIAIPGNVPGGLVAALQGVFLDPGAPLFYAGTNGLLVIVQ